jgi:hypothetical protein
MLHARGVLLCTMLAACAPDGVLGDDVASGDDAVVDSPDAYVGETPCDMRGLWIAEQHTTSRALNAAQRTTNWYYYRITQDGDQFTIVEGANCGFVVDGTTTVTIDDATLEALAEQESAGLGRGGTFAVDGSSCRFELDRSYNLRGANKARFLTDHWQVGDDPLPLSSFPPLPTEPPDMEDWDGDGMHGITLRTGLGNRYVSQRDWNEHAGVVPQYRAQFGGDVGSIQVDWDSQEGISTQTSPILRTTATPEPPGWARYARVDGRLEVVTTGKRPLLRTCRNVQQLAQEIWP